MGSIRQGQGDALESSESVIGRSGFFKYHVKFVRKVPYCVLREKKHHIIDYLTHTIRNKLMLGTLHQLMKHHCSINKLISPVSIWETL